MIESVIKEAKTNEAMPLAFQQNIRLKLVLNLKTENNQYGI